MSQKKDRSLLVAWCIFGVFVASFLVGTKFYYDAQDEESYKCIININEDVVNAAKEAAAKKSKHTTSPNPNNKKAGTVVSVQTPVAQNVLEPLEQKLYEKLDCGYVPRISADGQKVCDVYAAKFNKNKKNPSDKTIENKRKIYLVILLEFDTPLIYLQNIIGRLGDNKVTFVVPNYSCDLNEIVKAIISAGHEFFLQIPTQTSVPSKMQTSVMLFLANMSSEDLVNNLHILFASTKYAIGIANTTPTLLTKSANGMQKIADELTKRGLMFLNFEHSNEVIQDISNKNSQFICVNTSVNLEKNINFEDSVDVNNDMIVSIKIDNVTALLKKIADDDKYIVAPVTRYLSEKKH